MNIQEELFKLQDLEYKAFHSRLMPTVPEDKVIGVRVPQLRKLAKIFFKDVASKAFLEDLPHKYYEEDNIHAFVVEQIKAFDVALLETEKFLPYIDNWATCDMFLPKVFKLNKEKLLPSIQKWLVSDKTYTIRYGMGVLLKLFLDGDFKPEYLKWVADVKSEEYYIRMMQAWYFATALAKQYDSAIVYLTEHRLDVWTHNKTIQKAIESYRIDKETKTYLRMLKR
ncbi:MAG: DNA alkylation repair protein [Clostridia bacterium]|nr:DNA alkylation repair protein [Clostridia bacterium]